MMKLKFKSVTIFFAIFILFSCQSLQKNRDLSSEMNSASIEKADFSGVWKIAGQHATRGPYTGLLEIRKITDQSFSVIRMINYSDYKFENLNIEQIWTGHGQIVNNLFQIEYQLKQADYLNKAMGSERSPEDFKQKLIIQHFISNFDRDTLNQINSIKEGVFSESYLDQQPLGAAPIWKNLRQQTLGVSNGAPGLIKIAYNIAINPVINWYQSQPQVQKYNQSVEFKEKKQFFVFDPTDYEFYQANKQTLRIPNKFVDEISLVEEMMRRNSYAFSLKEKAIAYDKKMVANHINEYGMYTSAVLDKSGKFIKFGVDGDSNLWTGLYIMSQSMRFLTNQDPEALANIKKSTNGLFLTLDITNDKKEFARFVMKNETINTSGEDWRHGIGPDSDKMWLAGGNNDMFKGLLSGFLWSYLAVPKTDLEFHKNLREHILKLLDLKIISGSSGNSKYVYGLVALVNHDSTYLNKYLSEKESTSSVLGDFLNVNNGFYYGAVADWSGVNLVMISTITDILLAKELILAFPNESTSALTTTLKKSKAALLGQATTYRLTRRDFLNIAAYTFSYKENSESDKNKDGWDATFANSLWSLREFPIDKSRYDASFDYSLKPDWALSAWPRLPWKSVKEKKPVEFHMQGAYNYPIFECQGYGSTYVWKDAAFIYQGQSSRQLAAPGGDYLFSYWMAAWSGLLNPQD